MNETGVAQAIRARLITDTGSGGLWETAGANKALTITYIEGPKKTQASIEAMSPYIVVSLVHFAQDDTYEGDYGTYVFQLDVYDDNGSANTYGAVRGQNIGERIFGDALAQAGRVPSYGLHRHKLVLTTTGDAGAPYAGGLMYRTGVTPLHDVDFYRWAHTYEVRIGRQHT